MEKKTIGIIMQVVAGLTAVVMGILIWKWAPVPVVFLAVSAVVGFVGNKFYREG